ncbi:MAG TPA: phospholipase D-like domain-containing protein [Pyrinomonadaceae bacterium]|jgi:cardiolipin synthase|nr:phospholipase D-like domain-containing protein [Pyrinomonadaceae bacterium]
MDSTAFLVIAIIAIAVLSFMLFLALFEPGLDYKISTPSTEPIESDQFLCILEAITDAKINYQNRIEVLTNGEVYYEAELEAIRAAHSSVNLEAYIFQKGEVTRKFIEALTERARDGVEVRLTLDAIGSFASWESYFKELREAGGRVAWYHGFKWSTLARINNRTHREIIVVDGRVGFLGGAGFADHWLKGDEKNPRWRDSMFRVEGPAVSSLQAAFVENWLEASGEILTDIKFFPAREDAGGEIPALIIDSSPTTGMSTRARILFQTLLASAQKSILITTPYFLPDRSARREMIRAIEERGVEVKIIVPGKHSDHLLTRRSSRRLFGDLLKVGAEIYEYEPAMIHAKTMVIDDLWCIVGSTNFDNRSFGLNDEVNLAGRDEALSARLREDFARDMEASHAVSYEEWSRRSIFERMHEWVGWVLERQQ